MFEAAELGRKLDKKTFKDLVTPLRAALLQEQFKLSAKKRPVIIIVEGVDNGIKGELINRLNEWFDTRGLEVHAFGHKTEAEHERPRFWRYWMSLPARGRIGIFSSSWYTGTLYERTFRKLSARNFDVHMKRISSLEESLAADGALILKFWLHMSKDIQRSRFKRVKKEKKTRWMVSKMDLALHDNHKEYIQAAERAIRMTDNANAPWLIVEAEEARYRDATVAQTILKALEGMVEQTEICSDGDSVARLVPPAGTHKTILDGIDLSQSLGKDTYSSRLDELQNRLTQLSWQAYHQQKTTVMVFEGWDAAGKGGAIRRVMNAVDARIAQVISIAAPTDEELAHHYLWRFWRHIPRAGRMIIYDRSWYGRVLVERVEGFARAPEWRRAYLEINDFEEQLTEHGFNLLKFWIHIDPDEQLTRFKEREQIPYKQHKITDEDWRNREKWGAYELAINDMVARTSTDYAPWTLIPGNDKKLARIKVLETVCERLENSLGKR
ncbi:MAG: polyphosphate:AMP phosphotransferase [Pseudomonadales bacterium]|nr:polyphosphate:AMP phosphotransferase [Pseudomonadales bacterium]